MDVDKCKRCVIKAESNGHTAFVSSNSRESSFNFALPYSFYAFLVLLLYKHDYVAANHHFLDDWDVSNSKLVHVESSIHYSFPQFGSISILRDDYVLCDQIHHLLDA